MKQEQYIAIYRNVNNDEKLKVFFMALSDESALSIAKKTPFPSVYLASIHKLNQEKSRTIFQFEGLTVRQAIIDYLEDSGGKKHSEITADITMQFCETGYNHLIDDLVETLYDMPYKGECIEIEYTCPDNPEKIRSFFLPAGSTIVSIKC